MDNYAGLYPTRGSMQDHMALLRQAQEPTHFMIAKDQQLGRPGNYQTGMAATKYARNLIEVNKMEQLFMNHQYNPYTFAAKNGHMRVNTALKNFQNLSLLRGAPVSAQNRNRLYPTIAQDPLPYEELYKNGSADLYYGANNANQNEEGRIKQRIEQLRNELGEIPAGNIGDEHDVPRLNNILQGFENRLGQLYGNRAGLANFPPPLGLQDGDPLNAGWGNLFDEIPLPPQPPGGVGPFAPPGALNIPPPPQYARNVLPPPNLWAMAPPNLWGNGHNPVVVNQPQPFGNPQNIIPAGQIRNPAYRPLGGQPPFIPDPQYMQVLAQPNPGAQPIPINGPNDIPQFNQVQPGQPYVLRQGAFGNARGGAALFRAAGWPEDWHADLGPELNGLRTYIRHP